MSRVSLLAVAAALSLVATSPLQAADLLPPLPSMHEPIVEKQQIGEGWYLRGDVGYGATRLGRATLSPDRGAFTTAKLREGGTLGAGAGYRFNEHFRIDLTLDHRFSAGFTATDTLVPGHAHDRANFSATTGLVNAYVDLGNWNGITPYIGGGIGMSNKQMTDYVVDLCVSPCDLPRRELRQLPNKSRNDFAWALMAGIGVDVGGGATLDLGYRYVNFGTAQSGAVNLLRDVRLSRLESHEVRAGLRWHFGSSSRGW